MSLTSVLPAPTNPYLRRDFEEDDPNIARDEPTLTHRAPPKREIPPYGKRQGWIPRAVEDFGDGGAFPEIHVAQYPLDMGKKKVTGPNSGNTVALATDGSGNVKYDVLLHKQQGKTSGTKFLDLVPKIYQEEQLKRPDPEEEKEVTQKTKEALEAIVNGKIISDSATKIATKPTDPTFIKYTPSQQSDKFNSGASSRIIRMVEMPKDPLEPPKFRHKKVPGGPPSPPVPVMHSPPRKVTVKDQNDWKIPPCISNWKNAKGFTIPLDKRLAADGRGLQEVQINDNFAKLSESLYIAERNARDEVRKRSELQQRLKLSEKKKQGEMLKKLAQDAREGRLNLRTDEEEEEEEEDIDVEGKRERDQIRHERKRERERDRRMEAAGKKKTKLARDDGRDVSEKIALGQAVPQMSKDAMFDARLFNQDQGMASGFDDNDDSYNIYDKPLLSGSSANQIYRPRKGIDQEIYGGGGENETEVDKVLKAQKPARDFEGAERDGRKEVRTKPVEFEKEEEDPFGLDEFLQDAKKGASKLSSAIGKNTLHASAGGGSSSSSSSSRKH